MIYISRICFLLFQEYVFYFQEYGFYFQEYGFYFQKYGFYFRQVFIYKMLIHSEDDLKQSVGVTPLFNKNHLNMFFISYNMFFISDNMLFILRICSKICFLFWWEYAF